MTTETNKIAKATYIKKSRSTEKAIIATDKNKYVFEVDKRANKDNLRQEITKTYKVTPLKINIINTPDKVVMRKGRPGTKSGIKKAIVTLKKGDKIDVI
jgi:large subunit ribosomal protein L23